MNDLEKLIEEKAKALVNAKEEKPKEDEPQPETTEVAQAEPRKSYIEQANEIIGVLATQEAIKDENLVKDVTNMRKAALLNNADADMKREEAENKNADIELQKANFGVNSGVASYAGIKKPLPKKMQGILFTILSVVQTIFLIAIGVPISIINICADGIDSVVKKLGTLTKSAMWIVLVLIIVAVIWVAVWVGKFFLTNLGIIT
jgi:hypothetical protein